jgi:hypothetical protein
MPSVADSQHELEQARKAKSKAADLFRPIGQVNGVGITRKDGHYAVKVNLESEPKADPPQDIDGVPVVVHITGKIHKQ